MAFNWDAKQLNNFYLKLLSCTSVHCSSAHVHSAMHIYFCEIPMNALCRTFHMRTQLSPLWHSMKHKGQHGSTEMMTTMSSISIQIMECALLFWFFAMVKFNLIHINSFGSDICIVLYRPNPSVGRSLWARRILCQINSHINMAICRNEHERVLICVL